MVGLPRPVTPKALRASMRRVGHAAWTAPFGRRRPRGEFEQRTLPAMAFQSRAVNLSMLARRGGSRCSHVGADHDARTSGGSMLARRVDRDARATPRSTMLAHPGGSRCGQRGRQGATHVACRRPDSRTRCRCRPPARRSKQRRALFLAVVAPTLLRQRSDPRSWSDTLSQRRERGGDAGPRIRSAGRWRRPDRRVTSSPPHPCRRMPSTRKRERATSTSPPSARPDPLQTLKRKCMTSPSCTTYSLPSTRKTPAARQPASPLWAT